MSSLVPQKTNKNKKRVSFAINIEEVSREQGKNKSYIQNVVHQELLQNHCHNFAEYIRSGYRVLYDLKKGSTSFLIDFYGKPEMKKSCERYRIVVCDVISDTMMELLEDTFTSPDYYDEHDSCAISFVKYNVRVNQKLPFIQ